MSIHEETRINQIESDRDQLNKQRDTLNASIAALENENITKGTSGDRMTKILNQKRQELSNIKSSLNSMNKEREVLTLRVADKTPVLPQSRRGMTDQQRISFIRTHSVREYSQLPY